MKRKFFLMLMCAVAMVAGAQEVEGTWKNHSMFGANIENVADASGKVYYLVNNCLYRYDKATKATLCLDKSNVLSDVMPTGIYYNINKDYLVVTYRDFNIDVVLGDGRVVNVTAVKDAVLTSSKVINDVTFASGEMVVSADFGYIVIDDNNFRVKETHLFNVAVNSAAKVGESVLVVSGDALYCSVRGKNHDTLEAFHQIDGTYTDAKLYPISDTKCFVNGNAALSVVAVAQTDTTPVVQANTVVAAQATNVQATGNGFIANFMANGYYYTFDGEGSNGVKVDGGKELYTSVADGSLWALGTNGLHKSGESEYAKPQGISLAKPYWIGYNSALGKTYLSNSGRNGGMSETANGQYVINAWDGSNWADATPENRSNGGPYAFTFDVKDPNTYYQPTWTGGLYKVTNDKIVTVYNSTNSLMANNYKPSAAMDSAGNLWVVQNYKNTTSPVMVLPREKVLQGTVGKSDWIGVTVPNMTSQMQRTRFMVTKKNDIKIFADGDYTDPLFLWDNKGDVTNAAPDNVKYTSITDQDNKAFSWTYIYALAEDSTGLVWIGATEGVVAFDPVAAFKTGFKGYRPVVDGGYLLDGIQCNAIVVDSQNRKWIGTNNAGVYVVNADGTQILKQYTMSNSMLPSNQVYRMAYADKTNSVFVVTPDGVAEFTIGGRESESDYSNVYVYPSPVRPDYTGMITIGGLMDNSWVTIKNEAGETLKTLKSTGSTVVWNGCKESGERYETGVYEVWASQTEGEVGDKPVAKIMIIK